MTNAQKFLKDGVDVDDFVEGLGNYIKEDTGHILFCVIQNFLKQQATPTLTEDERVILKNIKGQPRYISRQKGYDLMAYDSAKRVGKTGWSYDNGRNMYSFSHLFQFIKEGESYEIKELLR